MGREIVEKAHHAWELNNYEANENPTSIVSLARDVPSQTAF